jgi:hypothetical protein
MQNASEAGAETPISAPQIPKSSPVPSETPSRKEIGGPEGPEPTRYGDWEKKGRCIDF